MDRLATALLSLKASGQRQSVYDSYFIKMRLRRQRPVNLGNKPFSGHEVEGNVTFPSADVLFGSDEKIDKLGTVDIQVSHHYLPINPRLRDALAKTKNRDSKTTKSPEKEKSRPMKNPSEISRSGQNFPSPTFFEVTFYTPAKLLPPFVRNS